MKGIIACCVPHIHTSTPSRFAVIGFSFAVFGSGVSVLFLVQSRKF